MSRASNSVRVENPAVAPLLIAIAALMSGRPVAAQTACVNGTAHSVTLSWTASISPGVAGYHVYRATRTHGPYVRINSEPVTTTSYQDPDVLGGRTYYYVVTALDASANESAYSNEAAAPVPPPCRRLRRPIIR